MPPLTDPVWVAVGIALTVVFGIAGVIAWRWPRAPQAPAPAKHETVWVEVSNNFLVYDQPDGTQDLGNHLVGVTIHNGSAARVKVVSWGIRLPNGGRLHVPKRVSPVEPLLPHWVEAGDAAEWFVEAADIRQRQAEFGCKFDEMIPYVALADGRELLSERGVLLK